MLGVYSQARTTRRTAFDIGRSRQQSNWPHPSRTSSLFHRKRRTDSIMYQLQGDRGTSGTVEPEPNDEDYSIDVLNVCVRLPFKASSYDHIARVAVEHTGPLIQLWRGWWSLHSFLVSVLTLLRATLPGNLYPRSRGPSIAARLIPSCTTTIRCPASGPPSRRTSRGTPQCHQVPSALVNVEKVAT